MPPELFAATAKTKQNKTKQNKQNKTKQKERKKKKENNLYSKALLFECKMASLNSRDSN
jgi:hypothetical protein